MNHEGGTHMGNLKILSLTLTLAALTAGAKNSQAGGYAAIAFSPATSVWGEYHGANSAQEAELGALRACAVRTVGCQPLVWVQNGYLVLVSNNFNQYFYGSGSSYQIAAQNAQAACGYFCSVRAWNFAFW